MERLPGDRETERAVRDVLEIARVNPGGYMSTADIARRVERPEATVGMVLSELAKAFVLRREGDTYGYDDDPVNDLDVKRFMRRAEVHSAFVQTNVAKFRERRYGHM
jgi:hypothetical protein